MKAIVNEIIRLGMTPAFFVEKKSEPKMVIPHHQTQSVFEQINFYRWMGYTVILLDGTVLCKL